MKYISEIEIDRPIDKVVDLFDNPRNVTRWMTGLKTFVSRKGAGIPGRWSGLYSAVDKPMVITEIIAKQKFPYEFKDTYESDAQFRLVNSRFEKAGPGRTRYISQQEINLKGIRKVLGPLLKGVFIDQTRASLQDFKRFVEQE